MSEEDTGFSLRHVEFEVLAGTTSKNVPRKLDVLKQAGGVGGMEQRWNSGNMYRGDGAIEVIQRNRREVKEHRRTFSEPISVKTEEKPTKGKESCAAWHPTHDPEKMAPASPWFQEPEDSCDLREGNFWRGVRHVADVKDNHQGMGKRAQEVSAYKAQVSNAATATQSAICSPAERLLLLGAPLPFSASVSFSPLAAISLTKEDVGLGLYPPSGQKR